MSVQQDQEKNNFNQPQPIKVPQIQYGAKTDAVGSSSPDLAGKTSKASAKIVQFSDETKTLPDGSKIIYAENEEKIVLYQKKQYEKGKTFVYERLSGKIFVNGREGSNEDKREMIRLGAYMLGNCKESDMITINIQK